MSLTKKFGALLLLLTIGSLIGIAAFASFFINTASDGLFLIASQIEIGMLQQIQIHVLMIRQGDEATRPAQLKLIEGFGVLITTMENGGKSPARPLALLSAITRNGTSDAAVETTVRAMQQGLPKPPGDLRERISKARSVWDEIQKPLELIALKPQDDPEARAAYDAVRTRIPQIDAASRLILARVGERITAARERMLVTLASIGGLSLALFVLGIWFTKRYVSRPIEVLEKAARKIHDGDYSGRVPAVSNDELASLAAAMNEMCVEIERSVERYRDLFENASDLIYTIDLEGNFLSVNRAAERVSGYTRDEILKMNMSQILPKDQLELVKQMRARKLSGEQQTTVYPLQMIAKDGRIVSMEVSTRLVCENGQPVAVQGLCRDITERRRLEEQLWIAQKMEAVGRLAGGIAHEFGNVLTIIMGYCALLLSSLKKDDPLRDEVDGIQKAAQRAVSLIGHLLGFSKGQVFRPKTVDLREALPYITDMLLRLIGEDIELATECAPDLGYIRFDPAQLEQILVNLTLNSRDAMPSGGKLKIRAANVNLTEKTQHGGEDVPPGFYVRLSVEDTGCGMTPEVRSRMFEPFFSTKERGTGLGLSTVYGIVQQCGGTISVESHVDRGTTFSILLPRFTAPPDEPPKEELAPSEGKGTETILVVEDEEGVLFLVREMLRSQGYRVLEAQDQRDAISICAESEPRIDLMLTDVVMPHMSGPELAAQVRDSRPEMKILYMSGYAQDKFESYLENGEVPEFIQKPLTPETLAAKVREVLDSSGNGTHGRGLK